MVYFNLIITDILCFQAVKSEKENDESNGDTWQSQFHNQIHNLTLMNSFHKLKSFSSILKSLQAAS